MTIAEDQQLGLSEYWDSRYANSNNNDPTHEWFRSFSQVLPFLQKNLLEQPGRTAQDDPRILHLGSGDSVSRLIIEILLQYTNFSLGRPCWACRAWLPEAIMCWLFSRGGWNDDREAQGNCRNSMEQSWCPRYAINCYWLDRCRFRQGNIRRNDLRQSLEPPWGSEGKHKQILERGTWMAIPPWKRLSLTTCRYIVC